jgi:hypothetical protein
MPSFNYHVMVWWSYINASMFNLRIICRMNCGKPASPTQYCWEKTGAMGWNMENNKDCGWQICW